MTSLAEATTMLAQLETSMGVPTFALFANWKGEYSVDVDEEAGRIFATMVLERMRRENGQEIAILLAARGGDPEFADAVLRAIWHLGLRAQVVILTRVDGAVAHLAIGAESITLHPLAGLGALDSGLLAVPPTAVTAGTLAYFPVSPLDAPLEPARELLLCRVAEDRRVRAELRTQARRLLERKIEDLEERELQLTFEESLGKSGTLDSWGLSQLGLECRVAPGPLAEQLEELLRWAGAHLRLYGEPPQRYRVSDSFAEEVEFDLATTIEAAAILSSEDAWIYELDTGSPDPDALKLKGNWKPWDPEKPPISVEPEE